MSNTGLLVTLRHHGREVLSLTTGRAACLRLRSWLQARPHTGQRPLVPCAGRRFDGSDELPPMALISTWSSSTAPSCPQIQHTVDSASMWARMRRHGRPLRPAVRATTVTPGQTEDMTKAGTARLRLILGGLLAPDGGHSSKRKVIPPSAARFADP